MRLICPNCEAQYNVGDDAIPEGGRDVQCSNCQQTWFQTEKPFVEGRGATSALTRPLPKVEVTETSPADATSVISEMMAEDVAEDMADDAAENIKDIIADDTPKTPQVPPRKALDTAVADILREEAEREDSVQKSIPGSDPTPPPLTQTERRIEAVDADETRKRIAQMTEDEGGVRTGEEPAYDDRRSAIPDINEINAALRARAEASDVSGLTEAEKLAAVQRRGFRGGFLAILVLFAILIGPYFFADQITENLPQTRGFMAEYTTTIDQLRVRLDDLVGGFFE